MMYKTSAKSEKGMKFPSWPGTYALMIPLYPLMALANVGNPRTNVMLATMKTMAVLDMRSRVNTKSRMIWNSEVTEGSFCRNIIEKVLYLIEATSMDVVMYLENTRQDR